MSADVVQQIKDRLNIADVVSAYVELHKAGRHFKGKSPFTTEKTPSFYVSPDRGMYYCFSTSQGGDMFTFVETMEGVDFKGALKILAEKANVELVPVSPQKKNERDRLYQVMEEATNFYVSRLQNAEVAKKYLSERGVNETSLEAWRIGFAPGPPDNGWREVKDYLLMKGYTESELIKAGLVKESSKGKETYDVFRNRIMFPLFDQGGRVVGFSGRTLEVGPEIPKYVNSPETELYKKSELLYGYDKAKKGIRNLDFSMIVEGQFDVVMSHQSGYINTVAVSGTALTPLHVQLLERISNRVVLALDSDKAGLAAVKRAADLMLRRGFDVKVAMMPKGKDPADMVLKDVREFKQAIGHSMHVIEFLLKHLVEQNLEERTFKLRAREEIIPYILLLPNRIDQDHFETKLAETLKTTKEAIHYEVERISEDKGRGHDTEEKNSHMRLRELKVQKCNLEWFQ
jgi:DNA primase